MYIFLIKKGKMTHYGKYHDYNQQVKRIKKKIKITYNSTIRSHCYILHIPFNL